MIDETAYPEFVVQSLKKIATTDDELEDLLYQWDERCGMRHYEGGQEMEVAEKLALQEILKRLEDTSDESI